MVLSRFVRFYFIFWCIGYGFETAMGIKEPQSCAFTLNKSMPTNGLRDFKLTINTNLQEEIKNLREGFDELLKREFAFLRKELAFQRKEFLQQREEYVRISETLKSQREELTIVNKELFEQKKIKNFIKSELQIHQQNNQEFLKNQLNSSCGQGFFEQKQKLTEYMNSKFLDQKEEQKKLAKRAIEPPQPDLNLWDRNFNCTRQCNLTMDIPSSCEEAMPSDSSKNGVYFLKFGNTNLKPFYAYCQRIDNKIWTIVQRREDGSVDFYRNWEDYKHGFGNLYGEFWIGLERLHALTTQHKHELQIWMKNSNGTERYVFYDQFLISSETEQYKLTVGKFKGDTMNDLSNNENGYHNGMKFSTFDNCNDKHGDGQICCARSYKGAWWFNDCYHCHLNGLYNSTTDQGIDWNGFEKKLKYVQMAIRRV